MKKEAGVIAIAGLLLLGATGFLLQHINTTPMLLPWLLAAALCWALVMQQFFSRLDLNRAAVDTDPYPDLGLANALTLVRGWMIAATCGFLLIKVPSVALIWIAAAFYSVAAILDRVDGWIARLTRRSSLLGAELDTVFDALGLLIAPLLALKLGKIHPAYLLVSVAYYLFVLGIYRRKRRGAPVYPLHPSSLRRTLAGFQMAYVAVVLWPPFDARYTVLAGFGFMVPLLTGFVVDWLAVSGRISMQHNSTQKVFSALHNTSQAIALPLLRITTALLLLLIADNAWLWLLAAMLATGLAARFSAMTVLIVLAWTAPQLSSAVLVLLFASILLLLLGSGSYSLWNADDDWVNRQDGA